MLVSELTSGLVAVLHLYFLYLEMFAWEQVRTRKIFGIKTAELAQQTRVLAANQGLYNGFLAAGLAWGLWLGAGGTTVKIFFLGCVIVAGMFGGLTVSRKIYWVQAAPGIVALMLVVWA